MGMMSEEMTTWGEGGCQNNVVLVVRVTRKNKNYFFLCSLFGAPSAKLGEESELARPDALFQPD
jgi:hypothetical protein